MPDEVAPRLVRRRRDGRAVVGPPAALSVRRVVRRLAARADRAEVAHVQPVVRIRAPAVRLAGLAREAERVAPVPEELDLARLAELAARELAHDRALLVEDVDGHLRPLREREGDARALAGTRRARARGAGDLGVGRRRGRRRCAGRVKGDLPPVAGVQEREGPRVLVEDGGREVPVRPRRPLDVEDGRHLRPGREGVLAVRNAEGLPRDLRLAAEPARERHDLHGRAGRIERRRTVEERARREVEVVRAVHRVLPDVDAVDGRVHPVLGVRVVAVRARQGVGHLRVDAEAELHEVAPPVAVLRTVRVQRVAAGERHLDGEVEGLVVMHERERAVLRLGIGLGVPAADDAGEVPVIEAAVDDGGPAVLQRPRAHHAVRARRAGEGGEDGENRRRQQRLSCVFHLNGFYWKGLIRQFANSLIR